jgi:hypothetical protein
MSARSDRLAANVEEVNKALLAATEASSDEHWRAVRADGVWTQGFSAFHAASSIGFITGMVKGVAAGEPFPAPTMEDIDKGNAEMAKEHTGTCTKAQTIELIKESSPAAASLVRGFSDAELDPKTALLQGMPEMTVEQIIEMLLVGHAAGHTASIVNAR